MPGPHVGVDNAAPFPYAVTPLRLPAPGTLVSPALFAFAIAAPTLLAYNAAPSVTLLNELLAFIAWGAVLRVGPRHAGAGSGAFAAIRPLGLALVLLILAAIGSWLWTGWPGSLALPMVLGLLAAGAVVVAGSAGARTARVDGAPRSAFEPFAIGMLVAAVASAVIAVLQVLWPDAVDGIWIAASTLPGRAVGNMRQPNHLSSVLLWGLVALVALVDGKRIARALGAALAALLVLGIVLTASRTGTVGVMLIAVWGLADAQLSRSTRIGMIGGAVLYVAFWLGMYEWALHTRHVFGGAERLSEVDLSASRLGIWSNTLAMIRTHLWAGVGTGNFNFAWTLSPFPDRPLAFFDHTHNLPLQLMVELGLPFALLVLGLLIYALWLALTRALAAQDVGARAAVVMLLLIGLHSMGEYPLWYAYFLLPTAWAWGYALTAAPQAAGRPHQASPPLRRTLAIAGAAMWLMAALAALDYNRVVAIYSPADDAAPLDERIARGQTSPLFAHYADYAAATSLEGQTVPLETYRRTAHSLLDTRLMIAWSKALAAAGDMGRASYVAQRLREFHKPDAAEFFAPCDNAPTPPPPTLPFQCRESSRPLTWRDLNR